MSIKLYKVLTEAEQEEIYQIVHSIMKRIKSKEITYYQGFLEIKYGQRFKDWINNLERIDEFYAMFLPTLHDRLLKGYKKIFEPLVKKGVVIASNAGTQLGIIRDGGIIPWDDDIDLVMDVKDYNKYKDQLRVKAIFNGWYPWERNWLKNSFKPYKGKNQLWVQYAYSKRLKFDFGKFTSSYFPFIDIFPGIRVDKNISQEDREDISIKLVEYYNSYTENMSGRYSKNQKLKNEAPNYFELINSADERMNRNSSKLNALTEVINKHYKKDSEVLMQLHPATPVFSNFDYTNKSKKTISHKGVDYTFVVSDNWKQQFEMEYGPKWNEPRRTHNHFILPWFIKIKNKYK